MSLARGLPAERLHPAGKQLIAGMQATREDLTSLARPRACFLRASYIR